MKRSAGDVLLAILEKVPEVNHVERLLEAANLRHVLNQCGYSDAAIKTGLKSKMPGELLLELLETRSGADLVAMLPPEGAPKAEKGRLAGRPAGGGARPNAPRAAATNIAYRGPITGLNKVGGIFLLFAVVMPALILAGFFPLWAVGTEAMWFGIATGGAALGGMIFAHGRMPAWTGLVAGALLAPGSLMAIRWWTAGRTTVFRIEIGVALLVGAVPAILLFRLLGNRFGKPQTGA